MKITDLLEDDAIKLHVKADSKADIIDQLVELHVACGNVSDGNSYKEAVLARESEGTTGISDGVAIPHAKDGSVVEPGLVAVVVDEGVDFDSLDYKPTNLFFMIAAPKDSNDMHLKMLSTLAQLLVDTKFVNELKAAQTPEEFKQLIDAKEKAHAAKLARTQASVDLVAVTACPTGIAHTYMAAEALENAACAKGLTIKVETQGSAGTKNKITSEDLNSCKGVIIAADKNINLDRFDGKKLVNTNVSKGINEAEKLIDMVDTAPVYHSGKSVVKETNSEASDNVWHEIYKNLMNGVSHMLPFVVGGGILIALAFLVDDASINPANFGMNTPLAAFFKTAGGTAFGFMLPILAGYIAMSIADRPGLAVGFVGGAIAAAGYNFAWLSNPETEIVSAGFLGALIAGFAGGYITLWLEKVLDKLPESLEGTKPVLLYPLFGVLLVSLVMFAINPLMATINIGITGWLNGMGTGNLILLGAVVGGMMSVDMGGPINKAAYVFGTAMLAEGTQTGQIIMAAVMVGGMVPPLVTAISTTIWKNRWSEDEQKAGLVNYIMGLSFISEGAIPFAAADPLRVLPSCIIGSAVAGAISAACKCACPAPHGGFWVIAVISNPFMYFVALAIGSLVGAVILSLWKKPLNK